MKKCIICEKIKNNKDFNKEHIIPEAIGGSLTIDTVCKECNGKLGNEIDSKIINDFLIKGQIVENEIKNKKNKEKVLFEKLTSNKNPQIKLRAKRGKNGEFEKWESNTSLKSSSEGQGCGLWLTGNCTSGRRSLSRGPCHMQCPPKGPLRQRLPFRCCRASRCSGLPV